MKFLKILALFLFVAISGSIYAQGCGDLFEALEDNQDCTGNIEQYSADVELPSYPGCTLTVNYEVTECQGVRNSRIVDFEYPSNDPDVLACLDFVVDFFNASNNDDASFFQGFHRELLEAISDIQFQRFLGTGPIAQFIVDCETGIKRFETNWYDGACTSYCTVRGDDGQELYIPVSCGSTCCIKRYSYCFNNTTGEIEKDVISIGEVVSGGCFFTDRPQCPNNTEFQSPCFANCALDNYGKSNKESDDIVQNTVFDIKVNAYPNPANKQIDIEITSLEEVNAQVTLTNGTGKTVFNYDEKLCVGTTQVRINDLNTLPEGVYFYHIQADNYTKTGKISIFK